MPTREQNKPDPQPAIPEAVKAKRSKRKKDGEKKHGLIKDPDKKYKPISIRLHPEVIAWARAEAKKRGIGYQSVINETLLELIAH